MTLKLIYFLKRMILFTWICFSSQVLISKDHLLFGNVSFIPIQDKHSLKVKKTFAVVIGISDYQDPKIPDLRYAHRDAEAFALFLTSPSGGSLNKEQYKLLINNRATTAQIGAALDWLLDVCTEGDQAIIYFAGHGDVETNSATQLGYLLAWDSPPLPYIYGTLPVSYLQSIVSKLSLQNKSRVLLITDACHAGKLAGNEVNGTQLTNANLSKQFANETKILSCQPGEVSIEGEQWGGGRGVFSFHLVEGLYGMADQDLDFKVSLFELDRFLEQKVSSEVDPLIQTPYVSGNKWEQFSTVFPEILTALRKNKNQSLPVFSLTDSRGLEEDVLANIDNTLRQKYYSFQKAIEKKQFFFNPNTNENYADVLFEKLIAEPQLSRLVNSMRRTYAAALLDDAQQYINTFLNADVKLLDCIGKNINFEIIPKNVERAAKLLGDRHYMYSHLIARKLFFEALIIGYGQNPNEEAARKGISLIQQSLLLESESPLAWHVKSIIYLKNLRKFDSAYICAEEARKLAPNWVTPFADLSYTATQLKEFEYAKKALLEAQSIDSLHPYVINGWAFWYSNQAGKPNKEKALALFEEYRDKGGPMYSCWHNDYGLLLLAVNKFEACEIEYRTAIHLDSTNKSAWNNLGSLYMKSARIDEAESMFKKSLSIDSTFLTALGNLGTLYSSFNQFEKAISIYKKCISIDSTRFIHRLNLGTAYRKMKLYSLSEQEFRTVIAMDSSNNYAWNNLGLLYYSMQKYDEAERILFKTIAMDTFFANPYQIMGLVYFKTSRPKDAALFFNKALEINAKNSYAYLGLAYLELEKKDTTKVIEYIIKAIDSGITFEYLDTDEELKTLKVQMIWKEMMAKYFPGKRKD